MVINLLNFIICVVMQDFFQGQGEWSFEHNYYKVRVDAPFNIIVTRSGSVVVWTEFLQGQARVNWTEFLQGQARVNGRLDRIPTRSGSVVV